MMSNGRFCEISPVNLALWEIPNCTDVQTNQTKRSDNLINYSQKTCLKD